jgi:hypothetical protein
MMDTILGRLLLIALAGNVLCGLAWLFALLRQVIAARSQRKIDGCRSEETLKYFKERHLGFPRGTLKILEPN